MLRRVLSTLRYSMVLSSLPMQSATMYAPMARFMATQPPQVPTQTQKHSFKTETKKLLDIVAKSIYTEKEVFLRELLSNCADALEKQKFKELTSNKNSDEPLQIALATNEKNRTLTIFDTGVGMNKEELISNLGTIARSGTQEFIKGIKESEKMKVGTMIGQFGVGFYSTFIVAESVEVISKTESGSAYKWVSDGNGEFEVNEILDPGFKRGTKITLFLKPECKKFCLEKEVDSIVKKYSLFISYPIKLNNDMLSSIQAIWYRSRNEISDDEYKRFFHYISNTSDNYTYKLHYTTDLPLSVRAVLYLPEKQQNRMSTIQEPPQISLYSKKILIKANCSELLPGYLRFVKGVIDCEDIPLNISREGYQDSALISKIKELITRRIIKLLEDSMNEDPIKYSKWFNEFGNNIKEGIVTDTENSKAAMVILRYNNSINDNMMSLDEYVKTMKPEQKKIYFLNSQDRKTAEKSPYFEPFLGSSVAVLIASHPIDEIFFRQINKYKEYDFVNIETDFADIEQNLFKADNSKKLKAIPDPEVNSFCMWIKSMCPSDIQTVVISKRRSQVPAMISSKVSSSVRQMMQLVDPSKLDMAAITLEVNPSHPINVSLNSLKKIDLASAKEMASIMLESTIAQSGLVLKSSNFSKNIMKLLDMALTMKLAEAVPKIEGKPTITEHKVNTKGGNEEKPGKTEKKEKSNESKPKASSMKDAKEKTEKGYTINEKGEIVI